MNFNYLVQEALGSLPEDIAGRLENLDVEVEQEPPPEAVARLNPGDTLLGQYHGVPLTKRGMNAPLLPDRISIYEAPIRRAAMSEADIPALVNRVVMHEIAHYFGIDDERLRDLGAY